MKLTSMLIPKKSKKEMAKTDGPINLEQDKYPWGLRLNFDTDAIEKLGIDGLDQGAAVVIHAEGSVVSKSVNERHGETSRSLEIQVKKIAVAGRDDLKSGFKEATGED